MSGRRSEGRVPMDEALAMADIVSLHCPLTEATDKIVNAGFLRKMRAGSVLINTGRGGLVDEEALRDAVVSGHLSGAYLDVLSVEPPGEDNCLLGVPGVVVTPHVAWSSLEARTKLIEVSSRNLLTFFEGSPENLVQPANVRRMV